MRRVVARADAAWDRNEYASALADYREVLRDHPEFPDIRNRVGLCRAMLGDSEGALEEFDHAVRVNPDYAEAHLNRSLVLNDLGRFDEARESFHRAQEIDVRPGDPYPADLGHRIANGHTSLGDLYLQAEQPRKAIEEYERALEVRPRFVDVRARLGRALLAVGEVERAADELNGALEQHPSFLGARLRLGSAYRRMGRTEDAIAEWLQCLELDPASRLARAFLVAAGVRVEEVRVPDASGSDGEEVAGGSESE